MFGEIEPIKSNAEQLQQVDRKPVIRPWSEQQRLAAERDTLGLYLSGHPVDEFLPELEQFVSDRIVNLKPEKETQLVAGLVNSVRTMKSRKGDTLAFVVLDDKSGRFEVSIFGKEYEQYRDLLHKDSILVVECQVTEDDYSGGLRGRVKELTTLQDYRQGRARRLTIHLDADTLANSFCDELAAILTPYRVNLEQEAVLEGRSAIAGESAVAPPTPLQEEQRHGCPIAVLYSRNDSEGCIMLGGQWVVSVLDDLLQRLRSEFGKRRITIQY